MQKNRKAPIVYMICGFIGAGKTTFARKLEKETGAFRVTKDEWMIKIFGNTPLKEKFDEYDEKVSRLSTEIAFELVRRGIDVILDDGFWVKAQRIETRKRIESLGARAVAFFWC